jgi:hypothetical protein
MEPRETQVRPVRDPAREAHRGLARVDAAAKGHHLDLHEHGVTPNSAATSSSKRTFSASSAATAMRACL